MFPIFAFFKERSYCICPILASVAAAARVETNPKTCFNYIKRFLGGKLKSKTSHNKDFLEIRIMIIPALKHAAISAAFCYCL